jgi:hypothetical protein
LTLTFFAGTKDTGLDRGPLKLYHGAVRLRSDSQTLRALRDLPKLLSAQ